MPNYPYKSLGTDLNRDFRNDLNENFKDVESDLRDMQTNFNEVVETVSEKAFDKVVETAKIDWLSPVNTFDDLSTTYPNAVEGKTAMARDSGKIYRFNGIEWIEIQDIDPTAINEVDSRLSAQLADTHEKLNSQPGTTSAMVTAIWDDGWAEDYTMVFPYFKSLGIKGNSAIVTGSIGTSGSWGAYMTPEQIKEMQDYGWGFLSHTVSHPHLPQLSDADLENELAQSKQTLLNMGMELKGIVYPYNDYDANVLTKVRKYYDFAFAQDYSNPPKKINYQPINQFAIYRLDVENPLSTNQPYIDECIAKKGWLVFEAHGMYYNPNRTDYKADGFSNMKANVNYCVSKGMEFVTANEAIERVGNSLTLGDDKYSEQKMLISKNGHVDFNGKVDFVQDITLDLSAAPSKFKRNHVTITYFSYTDAQNKGFPEAAGTLHTFITNDSAYEGSFQLFYSLYTDNIYRRRYRSGAWTIFTLVNSTTNAFSTQQYRYSSSILVPSGVGSVGEAVVTIPNISYNDSVSIDPLYVFTDPIIYTAQIDGNNQVRIRLINLTSTAVTITKTWKIKITKFTNPVTL